MAGDVHERETACQRRTQEFLGFSYGFRPKRNQHDALDALMVGIAGTKVNFILDADIRSFFNGVS